MTAKERSGVLNLEDGSIFDTQDELFDARGLFSKQYLEKQRESIVRVIPNNATEEAFWLCRDIYDRAHKANRARIAHGGLSESDTEGELIDKILPILGFPFLHRTRQDAGGVPDYVLFPNEKTKNDSLPLEDRERYRNAIGILEAKSFNKNLGHISKKETPGTSYSKQVRLYLSDAQDSQGNPYFEWGVLTNGHEWRLYSRRADRDQYLSLNLKSALNNLDDFKFFLGLFRREAFLEDLSGVIPLNRWREESQTRQRELELNLQKRVYILVEWIAQGFYENNFNKKEEMTKEKVYKASLILLYRLMFVLYAEARGLLPAYERQRGSKVEYRRNYSLQRFIPLLLENNFPPEDDAHTNYWFMLTTLFEVIDGSNEKLSERLDIPRYNGGLFDQDKFPELSNSKQGWRLGDWTVQETLKRLMFDVRPSRDIETIPISSSETIDYSTLSVQQLGSIYEGLLEHHPILTDNGHIEVRTESEERWLSGSYYTPNWVVDYILEETLRPLLDEIENSEAVQNAKKDHLDDDSFAKAALKLKILDPAMGSGHFLVRATEFLAEEIAYHPTTKTVNPKRSGGISETEAEIAYWRRRVVESSIYGVDKNELAVELAKLSLWLTCISPSHPLSFLDHHLKHGDSLTGTSLNEPAGKYKIEGLKEARRNASESVSSIIALSSDDYNSVKVKESRFEAEVANILDPYEGILDQFTRRDFSPKIDERLFALDLEARLIKRPLPPRDSEEELDWPLHFELAFPDVFPESLEGGFQPALDKNKESDARRLTVPVDSRRSGFQPDNITTGKMPVLRDSDKRDAYPTRTGRVETRPPRTQQRGFDAVIGNPPYVRQENLGELKHYLQRNYQTYQGTADLYVYFVERAMNLLKERGRFGMIFSNKWMRASYGGALREFVRQFQIEKLVDFTKGGVFPGIGVSPAIIIIKKHTPGFDSLYASIRKIPKDAKELTAMVAEQSFPMGKEGLAVTGFALVKKEMTDVFEKMKSVGKPLGEYVEGKIYRGIITGFNEAFVITAEQRERLINKDAKSAGIIVPWVVGDDVRKWRVNYRNRYLIFTRRGVQIEEYPAIEEHLSKWKERLTPKIDLNDESEGRKPGLYEWYEIQDSTDYYAEFAKPKIVWPDIAQESRFAFDKKGLYYGNTVYFSPVEDYFLLGFLNSKAVWQFLSRHAAVLGDPDKRGGVRHFRQYLAMIPISTNGNKDQIASLAKKALVLKDGLMASAGLAERRRLEKQLAEVEAEIDRAVYQLYGLTEKEIAVIEGKG